MTSRDNKYESGWSKEVTQIMHSMGYDPKKLRHEFFYAGGLYSDAFLSEKYPDVWIAFASYYRVVKGIDISHNVPKKK